MVKILLGVSIILMLFVLLTGCTSSPPEADFIASVTYGNVPITIQFTDQSTGKVQAWAWDFNNDQLIDSTAQSPQFTYTKPGTYTVILRAQGSGGTDLETKEAYIVLTPPANTISGVSPASGDRGLTMDVIILSSGTTFNEGSAVSFGSEITVNNFTVVSPSQITANISIDVYAAAGPRDVLATTPTGTAALSGGFTVIIPPTPTIAAVNPASGDQAAILSVSITGTGFRMATAIDFGDGITVNDYVINSTNQITADISIEPDAAAAPRDVLVGNPGGNTTLNQGFLVTVPPPPVVTGASPAFASRGETLDVVITGTGFNGATEVLFRSGLGVNVNSFTIDSPT
ncbi:MAG: PKD domain-containing protein, partial [Dehalococcoidia bacterium]|nr:PKD domain-containing protein [Dehalococcoidia bacterium]